MRPVHELKILPKYFEAVKAGIKTFEIRKNDRDYQNGDYLALREWNGEEYTGRSLLVIVTYIFELFGITDCAEGYVVMSIQRVKC